MIVSLSVPLFASALAAVAVALVFAAVSDLRRFTIPNRLCAIVVAAYPFGLFGMPLSTWGLGLATGVFVLLVCTLLFSQRWVGGGDVKLASAVALWAGPTFLGDFLMVMSIAAATLASALLFTPLSRVLSAGGAGVEGFSQPMPFGVAISAGGLWVVALQFGSFL